MEKDIEKLKRIITQFIEKYKIKTLKINTKIDYHSKFNIENSEQWILECYSKVDDVDVNLTK